jgi:hypothetical protein
VPFQHCISVAAATHLVIAAGADTLDSVANRPKFLPQNAKVAGKKI